jgi:hypothetical protein
MAVTEYTSSSTTPVVGTETTLATIAVAGIFLLRPDLVNLVAGDIVEFRVYAKCRVATDAERLKDGPASFGPIVPDEKLPDTLPIVSSGYVRYSILQRTGTARAFPWVVLSTGA